MPEPVAEALKKVQAKFDEAARLRVSPCTWLPPEWEELEETAGKKQFKDTDPDLPSFVNNDAARERRKQGHDIDMKDVDNPETVPSGEPGAKAWISPFTDFAHVDNQEFSNADVTLIAEAFDSREGCPRLRVGAEILEKHRNAIMAELKGDKKAQRRYDQMVKILRAIVPVRTEEFRALRKDLKEGAVGSALTKVIKDEKEHKALEELGVTLEAPSDTLAAMNAVNRLRHIVGDNTAGMKRLERLFEWALYRTTDLLSELNFARDKEDAYTQARDNYISFLNDLDDHEPEKGNRRLDPRGEPKGEKSRKSGYGVTIKWNCIKPVIKDGNIIGARVVLQWNPHSSSNGIPIQH